MEGKRGRRVKNTQENGTSEGRPINVKRPSINLERKEREVNISFLKTSNGFPFSLVVKKRELQVKSLLSVPYPYFILSYVCCCSNTSIMMMMMVNQVIFIKVCSTDCSLTVLADLQTKKDTFQTNSLEITAPSAYLL